MRLVNDIASVSICEITDISSHTVDFVYDLENYISQDYKKILLIEINTETGLRRVALYCDFCGNFEYCTVLQQENLVIAKFNSAYMINVCTGEIQYKCFSDMAGALRLYLLEDGYLIHGECEIVKLDFEFNTQWTFSGKDIFASLDGKEVLKIFDDRIEITDFSGNTYIVPLTPELVKQVMEKEEQYRSFKEVTENPIVLDFSACNRFRDVHSVLKEKFGFPDYYGKNWGALWDCLHGLFDDVIIEIHNFHLLSPEIQECCKPMFKIFEEVHKETPNVIFKIIS
ncbi:MAG: barstar family protein [Clostridia bacterium]|nr:barstar family protein [Clostridia bacterium]